MMMTATMMILTTQQPPLEPPPEPPPEAPSPPLPLEKLAMPLLGTPARDALSSGIWLPPFHKTGDRASLTSNGGQPCALSILVEIRRIPSCAWLLADVRQPHLRIEMWGCRPPGGTSDFRFHV